MSRVTTASPGPFHGEWKGDFITRACSGDCPSFRVGASGLPLTLSSITSGELWHMVRQIQ